MVGQDTSIDVVLRLQDLATKELKQFAKQTKKGGKTAEKSFKGVRKEVDKTGVSLKALAAGAVGFYAAFRAAKATVGAGLGFVDAASDAQESLSKFTVVFGEEAKRVEGAINGMAAAAGRSRFDIINFTGSLQDTFVPLGFARDEAADLSLAMTQLAIDVASFSNKADADVVRDFTSAITGSPETVKKYGIVINEAKIRTQALASGLIELGGELTDVSKAMAVSQLIFKGTSDAQGDAARTAGSWANRMKSLKAQIDKIRVEVGGFVRDELLLLIDSFGTAEEIGKKLTNAFALVGVATVTTARLLAALAKAILDTITKFGGLNGIVVIVGNFGIAVEQAFESLVAAIPFAVALAVLEFKKLKLEVKKLELSFKNFANELADIPIFGIGKLVSTAATRKQIKKLADEVRAASRTVAAESVLLAVEIAEIGTKADAARERLKEFAASLDDAGDGTKTLDEKIGELLTKKDGLLDFFKNLSERVTETVTAVKGLNGPLGALAKFAGTQGLNAGVAAGEAQAFNDAALPGAVVDREQQDAAEAQRDALREQADAAKAVWQETERQSSAWMGAQEAVDQYAASLSDFALTKDLVGGLFQTLESGLGQFSRDLVEGEAKFKEFAQSTIKQIGAMIIQFLLLKTVRGALGVGESGAVSGGLLGSLGFAKGGVMQGSMGTPVNAYANGGVASSPQLALFGEGRGAEAFVPLPDGKRIPVAMEGGGGGGANVTIQISAIDSQSGMEFLDKHAGRIGTNVANQIEAGMNRKLVKAVGR